MGIASDVSEVLLFKYGPQVQEEADAIKMIDEMSGPYSPWVWSVLGFVIGLVFGQTLLWALCLMLVTLISVFLIKPRHKTNFRLADEIANEAIVMVAKYYFEESDFNRYKGMNEDEFGTLFDKAPDDYWSGNMLSGDYKGMAFRICDVKASYEEEYETENTDSEGNTYTETETYDVEIFEGSILRLTLPFRFDNYLEVGPFRSYDTMDHQAFNGIYGVRYYDRVYARYVLTQSFMDNLVKLRRGFTNTPELRFTGKYLYVLMQPMQDFRTLSFTNVEGSVERYLNEIAFTCWVLEIIAIEDHHIMSNNTPDVSSEADYRNFTDDTEDFGL